MRSNLLSLDCAGDDVKDPHGWRPERWKKHLTLLEREFRSLKGQQLNNCMLNRYASMPTEGLSFSTVKTRGMRRKLKKFLRPLIAENVRLLEEGSQAASYLEN